MSENTKKRTQSQLSTTNIRISRETKEMLEKLGSMGDTFDDVIRRLIKEAGKSR